MRVFRMMSKNHLSPWIMFAIVFHSFIRHHLSWLEGTVSCANIVIGFALATATYSFDVFEQSFSPCETLSLLLITYAVLFSNSRGRPTSLRPRK